MSSMSKRTTRNKFFAFSLVELMAAIAIVSILVSLALPRFRAFIARSRMAEAKANLGILATLAQSYQIEYGTSAPSITMGKGECDPDDQKNALGFRLVVCDSTSPRYQYTGSDTFYANSNVSQIYPGCTYTPDQDYWSINKQRALNHGTSAIKNCAN